jgi:CDP-paratose 2-epimerase
MMRVLVTGSAGFVGTHLVQALEQRGDTVLGLDKKNGEDLADRSADWARISAVSFGPEVIVHLASVCSTPGSVRDPLGTFEDTVTSAATVLEAARMGDIPVVLTSSVKARDGMTPYGAAKRMVELWAQEYETAYDLPVVINRPGTIYGPGQEGSEDSGWIAWFCKARAEGLPVVINGTGTQLRDLLHVSDYVRLLLLQVDNIGTYRGHIWDVGGGATNTVSVAQMAAHLKLRATYGPARYGDAAIYVGDNGVPGWGPEIDWRKSETLR